MITEFQDYANNLATGFLKYGKASSMLIALRDIPGIMDDEVRFLKYLKSCLEMEGFNGTSIELIMGWLYERKASIVG
jgi:hypothetical protein